MSASNIKSILGRRVGLPRSKGGIVMGQIFTRPVTPEQREQIEKPSPESVQKAQDELFLNLLLRVKQLEDSQQGGDSYD